MRCKEHPKYAGKRHPPKTAKYPDGCPTCWGAWETMKFDRKRSASTVVIEMSSDEARVYVIALSRHTDKDPILMQLYKSLAVATKESQ